VWRDKNRELLNKKRRIKYKTDTKRKENARRWKKENLDKIKYYSKSWRLRDPEALKIWRRGNRQKKKLWWHKLIGGKCCICMYNKSINALQAHHIDKNTKHWKLKKRACAMQNLSYTALKEEAKKVILLCANCHAEVHEGITKIPRRCFKGKIGGKTYANKIQKRQSRKSKKN